MRAGTFNVFLGPWALSVAVTVLETACAFPLSASHINLVVLWTPRFPKEPLPMREEVHLEYL